MFDWSTLSVQHLQRNLALLSLPLALKAHRLLPAEADLLMHFISPQFVSFIPGNRCLLSWMTRTVLTTITLSLSLRASRGKWCCGAINVCQQQFIAILMNDGNESHSGHFNKSQNRLSGQPQHNIVTTFCRASLWDQPTTNVVPLLGKEDRFLE